MHCCCASDASGGGRAIDCGVGLFLRVVELGYVLPRDWAFAGDSGSGFFDGSNGQGDSAVPFYLGVF